MMIFVFIVLCLIGGWFARMDGGAPPKTPEWVERSLCISFFLYAAWCITQDWWALAAFAGVLGLLTGHGQYFLNRAVKAIEPEKADFIVRLFFGEDPRTADRFKHLRGSWPKDQDRIDIANAMNSYGMNKLYWRNVYGMAVTGSLVGLPAAILAIVYGAYFAAIPLALTGAAKAGGYVIAYWLYQKGLLSRLGKYLDHDTATGEFLNGFFRTALALSTRIIA